MNTVLSEYYFSTPEVAKTWLMHVTGRAHTNCLLKIVFR